MPLKKRKIKKSTKVEQQVPIKQETTEDVANYKPEAEPVKIHSSCRYKNCKKCKDGHVNDTIFLDNDCDLSNNNKEPVSPTAIKATLKTERNTNAEKDLSMYDYNEDCDQTSNNPQTENKCSFCKMVFTSTLELMWHRRDHHKFPRTILDAQQVEKYYDYPNRTHCPICTKQINSNCRSTFIRHLQTHTRGTSVCRICKQVFKSKYHMLSHQKRHVVQV